MRGARRSGRAVRLGTASGMGRPGHRAPDNSSLYGTRQYGPLLPPERIYAAGRLAISWNGTGGPSTDDATGPVENSLLFAAALREKRVACEIHILHRPRDQPRLDRPAGVRPGGSARMARGFHQGECPRTGRRNLRRHRHSVRSGFLLLPADQRIRSSRLRACSPGRCGDDQAAQKLPCRNQR